MYEIENILDYVNESKISFNYQECKRLYVNFGLGKKLVNALPELSLSSDRDIYIDNAPDEVKDQYIKTCKRYKIDDIVLEASILSRIYGMSAIMILTDKKDEDLKQGLSIETLRDNEIYFQVLDPLAFRVEINQDPLSIGYMKPAHAEVSGKTINKDRFFTLFNGQKMYIDFQQSNFNFAGQSVFANMRRFIVTWSVLFKALENIAIKASSILITNNAGGEGAGAIFSKAQDLSVAKRAAEIIKQMKQGAVAFLSNGQNVEFFNLNGAKEVAEMIEVVRQGFASALADTPSSLLLDKNLSNGLSEGKEDMKAIVMAVNNYRNRILNKTYAFIDSFMFYKAWDEEFIKEMKGKYPQDYGMLGINQIRELWINEFNFSWNSVYPKTPDEETKEKDGVLDRAGKAKELGVNTEDLIKIINQANVFGFEVTQDNFQDILNKVMQKDDDEQG